MLRLAEPYLLELIGDQVEDVFSVGLRRVAAVAIAPAELLQVVVQVPHSCLLQIVVQRCFLLPWCVWHVR